MYIAFLPNAMFAFYKVGMLTPLWSIGVEEQFYLFWAPFVRLFRNYIFNTVLAFTIVTACFQIGVGAEVWTSDPEILTFMHTLRFHFMGVGALFACMLFSDPSRLLHSWVTARWFQVLMLGLLLYHYTIGLPGSSGGILDLPLALLYAALIINVSLGPHRWMNLEWQPLIHLGAISYGIYMYHMALEYCLREIFQRLGWIRPGVAIFVAYGAILLALSILTAHFSYQYGERPLIEIAHRRSRQAISASA
jgi:peptidoglycan/LPS O-acetylase OafA/YrhL